MTYLNATQSRTASGKGSLMFYNHSYVSTTEDGKLNITTAAETTRWKGFNPYTKKREWFTKEFRGGMVNTWNKFCFSGAVLHFISLSLFRGIGESVQPAGAIHPLPI